MGYRRGGVLWGSKNASAPGQLEIVKDLVAHNIEVIKNLGAKTVIFSCAGCYKTFKEDYPKLNRAKRLLGERFILKFSPIGVVDNYGGNYTIAGISLLDLYIAYKAFVPTTMRLFPSNLRFSNNRRRLATRLGTLFRFNNLQYLAENDSSAFKESKRSLFRCLAFSQSS